MGDKTLWCLNHACHSYRRVVRGTAQYCIRCGQPMGLKGGQLPRDTVVNDASYGHKRHVQYLTTFDNGYRLSVVFGCGMNATVNGTHNCMAHWGTDGRGCVCGWTLDDYETVECAVLAPNGTYVYVPQFMAEHDRTERTAIGSFVPVARLPELKRIVGSM